jgi:transposase
VPTMSRFKPHDSFQLSLLPCSAGLGLPAEHPVRSFNQMIEEEIDLSQVLKSCKGEATAGRPAYHPLMMVKLIMYGYAQGITSGRALAKACVERLDFRFITGNQMPDHRSISRFRKTHLEQFGRLFEQSIEMAAAEDLIEMKEIAVDGTKVLADASKRKAMSYARMLDTSKQLRKEIYTLKQEVRIADGRKKRDLSNDLLFKRKRLKTIRAGKKKLEERAKAAGKRRPEDKAQINFTDPESVIMKVGSGFEQCFNAQAVVDKNVQIIVAANVTRDCNDKLQIEPMLEEMIRAVGLIPDRVLADSGYFSEANIDRLTARFPTLDLFIPPNKKDQSKEVKPKGRIPADISTADRMRRKLSTVKGKAVYKFRKAVVEPVFGQIKSANLKFESFSFRGLKAVSAEWKLICAIHNLWKIQRARAKKNKNQILPLAA